MNKKKIIYVVLLIVVLVVVGIFIFITANRTERLDVGNSNNTTSLGNRGTESIDEATGNSGKKVVTVTELNDGTLYAVTDKDIKADIVIGDNYFDTQLADINLNFSKYEGKTIEIEGFPLTNSPYTFVGRYSTANLCAYCPQGYSYFEYQWQGDKTPELKEEESWLKVKGTLKSAYDDSIGSDYYYIDVLSLEVMNKQGVKTVNN